MHLRAASECRDFVQRLLAIGDPRNYGWAVTATFYAALHTIRAYFGAKGVEVASHVDGERLFRDMPELRAAVAPFKGLKQASEAARYYNVSMTEKNVRDSVQMAERIASLINPKTRRLCPNAFEGTPPLPGT